MRWRMIRRKRRKCTFTQWAAMGGCTRRNEGWLTIGPKRAQNVSANVCFVFF